MASQQPSKQVTEARAAAQRAKLNAQAAVRKRTAEKPSKTKRPAGKQGQRDLQAKRRAQTTIARAIEDYLADHEGSNHSPKTLQWHQTALGLLRTFLEEERSVTLVGEIDATDLSAWFAFLRKNPGSRGKPRAERTVQTYARSVRAFLHWLVRQEILERSPFDKLSLPKVGKPLIRIIEPDEFERLLQACTPPGEMGSLADRAAARNRAILWLLYDTGIRLAELCNVRLEDFDRKHGTIIVKGKGSKERRIALGNNCLRNVLYYLDRHRPDEEELAQWGSSGEDHLFLSETRLPLTKNGVSLLVKRVRLRAGITDK
ncbi:MAG: tyrosine-type recombinase/integrase, partial [Ktedonobacteraceae bacterium]